MFNKNDYSILGYLEKDQCFTEIRSYTIKQIADETKLSIPKIRVVIKNFLISDYIREGARDGICKTYYITDKGLKFLKNAKNPNPNNELNDEVE